MCESAAARSRGRGRMFQEEELSRASSRRVPARPCRPARRGARRHAARGDTARYILPPGNYGGLPTTANSRDQLPLYDGAHAAARQRHRRRHRQPLPARELRAGRRDPRGARPAGPGLTIVYDAYGVPHVNGKTRADLAFGAGWVDGPRPRPAAPARPRPGARRGRRRARHRRVRARHQRPVVRAQRRRPRRSSPTQQRPDRRRPTATRAARSSPTPRPRPTASTPTGPAHGIDQPPATVNDVIAVTAFIGSIFGAGGGGEASNADLLAKLQNQLGTGTRPQGVGRRHAVRRPRGADHDQAAASTTAPLTGGPVTGSVVDRRRARSVPLDPRPRRPTPRPRGAAVDGRRSRRRRGAAAQAGVELPRRRPEALGDRQHARGDGPAARLLLPGDRRSRSTSAARASRPRASAVPGLAMYILIGRTQDYAWSLTSAGHDVRDVFAEQLCNPDGSPPTRASTHYLFKGECRAFETFDAGTLNGTPLALPDVGARPRDRHRDGRTASRSRSRASARRSAATGSTSAALQDMTDGQGHDAAAVLQHRQPVRLHVQLGLRVAHRRPRTSRRACCRARARGLDRRLPTLGTGDYEWRGFLTRRRAPARRRRPRRPAAELEQPVGARLHARRRRARTARCTASSCSTSSRGGSRSPTTSSVMNRAATEDVRSPVWPVVSRVLHGGAGAERAATRRSSTLLDDWVAPRRAAPRRRQRRLIRRGRARRSWTRSGARSPTR